MGYRTLQNGSSKKAVLVGKEYEMTIEIPTCAPCPKCAESDRLIPVKSASVGYVQCDACKYMGPQLMAKEGTPEPEFVNAVVRAWNNAQK